MRSLDVPQADNLSRVRAVVDAVASGDDAEAIALRVSLAPRHVSYHLHAARVLDLVTLDPLGLTARGRALVQTTPGSAEERAVLRRAVGESSTIRRLAPGLLGPEEPDVERLVGRVRDLAGLALATARRRAQALLRWRAHLRSDAQGVMVVAEPAPPLPPPPAAPSGGASLRRLQIARYGPIRGASATFGRLQVVVGPNASGKSTFFDALAFLADALERGVAAALRERAPTLGDLLWRGEGKSFAFAVEIVLPSVDRVARYELEVGELADGTAGVAHEALFLIPATDAPDEIVSGKPPKTWRRVLAQGDGRAAFFRAERGDWKTVFQLPPSSLALANVLPSVERFPVALRVRDFLRDGVVVFALSVPHLRAPCSPLLGPRLCPDGQNLPLVIDALRERAPLRYAAWVRQLREALPLVREVRVVEREEDRHRYVKLRYRDGLQVPAWRLSDGTLRVLALTLLGYLDEDAVWLIEEPENGVHPQAIEAVYEALSASPRAQVMIATHSPVFLGITPPQQLLCFSHDGEEVSIVAGDRHPALVDGRQDLDLATLFAAGVLG